MYEPDEDDVKLVYRRINTIIDAHGLDMACYQIADVIKKLARRPVEQSLAQYFENEYEGEDEYPEEDDTLMGLIQEKDIELASVIEALLGEKYDIISDIANQINEETEFGFELKNEDIPQLMNDMNKINGALYLLDSIKKNYVPSTLQTILNRYEVPSLLQDVVIERINEMTFNELVLLMRKYDGEAAFQDNDVYDKCLINQINKMKDEEFAYFLSQEDLADVATQYVRGAIKERVQKSESAYLTSMYIARYSDVKDINMEPIKNSAFIIETAYRLREMARIQAAMQIGFYKQGSLPGQSAGDIDINVKEKEPSTRNHRRRID